MQEAMWSNRCKSCTYFGVAHGAICGRVNAVLHEVLRYIIPHNPNLKSVPRTRKWFEMDPSTHRQWLDIVQEIFIMEKLLFL